ncbi:hypothetical protein KAZ93_03560 [Patescibacteria group bacterium]|nr:hypothetical protein [Patescibacteria group bacterium]
MNSTVKNLCFVCFFCLLCITIAGCQSQTDQFLSQIDQDIARQQAERNALSGQIDSGSSLSETLLGGDTVTTDTNTSR